MICTLDEALLHAFTALNKAPQRPILSSLSGVGYFAADSFRVKSASSFRVTGAARGGHSLTGGRTRGNLHPHETPAVGTIRWLLPESNV